MIKYTLPEKYSKVESFSSKARSPQESVSVINYISYTATTLRGKYLVKEVGIIIELNFGSLALSDLSFLNVNLEKVVFQYIFYHYHSNDRNSYYS